MAQDRIAQDSVLSSILTSYMAKDLMLTKFIDNMKLEGILNAFIDRFRIQKDLNWLNKWPNLTTSKPSCLSSKWRMYDLISVRKIWRIFSIRR